MYIIQLQKKFSQQPDAGKR